MCSLRRAMPVSRVVRSTTISPVLVLDGLLTSISLKPSIAVVRPTMRTIEAFEVKLTSGTLWASGCTLNVRASTPPAKRTPAATSETAASLRFMDSP
ncbi:hypothetical protein D3C72_2321060 [compost metagenome]